MDSLKKLIDKIQKFYKLVEVHNKQLSNWLVDIKRPCHSIVNQSILLRAVLPEDSVKNSAFSHFERFREDLFDIILSSLEDEIVYLEEFRIKLKTANQTLRKEQKFIENLYVNLKKKNQISTEDLNPCSPRLEHIITWCSDIWSHYHSFYLQISQAILSLNFEDEATVTALTESLKENAETKKKIHLIKCYNISDFEFLA